MNRRTFIKAGTLAGGAFFLPSFNKELFGASLTEVIILHTNDTHSRIDPFPASDPKYPGMGGLANRKSFIDQVRAAHEHVLLLDAGDIFQGTPYFNVFNGEVEFKGMSMLGYDASTLGNHDFDIGLDGFNKVLPHARFPFISSNYDFTGTPLEGKTKTYTIFRKGRIKIGVFGLGVELQGLVDPDLYGQTKYLDPLPVAQKMSTWLKEEEKCDLIICLSHLGYEYPTGKISDIKIAEQTKWIDLIIGGHTHTFLKEPAEVKNRMNEVTLVAQTGWAGINVGKISFTFTKENKKTRASGTSFMIKDTAEKC